MWLADVVRAPIDYSVLPKDTPQRVRRLLRRCLDRNLKNRLRDIGEARVALEQMEETEEPTVPAVGWRWWPGVAGVLVVALLGAGVGWYKAARPGMPRQMLRLNAELAPGAQLARVDAGGSVGGHMFDISPDGTRLAFTMRSADGRARIYTRLLGQCRAEPLAGTENAHSPFFSPRSDWIGFFAEGKMKKIAVEGGAAVTLCDAPVGVGAGWSEDGNSIIVALSNTGGLWRVSASGGQPEVLTQLNPGEASHRWPFTIPGSQLVLFTSAPQIGAGYDDATIEMVSLKTGERRTVQRGGFYPRYLADGSDPGGSGHLIYLHQATLFAVPFHPGGSTLPGAPVPILNDVSSTQAAGGDFAFARNGTFVYSEGKGSLPKWPIFLGGSRWQFRDAARPARPILLSAVLAGWEAAGVFDEQRQGARYLGERFEPGGPVALQFFVGCESSPGLDS